MKPFLSIVLLLASLTGCGFYREKTALSDPSENTTPVEASRLSFRMIRERVLERNCISCHGSAGGVNLESYAEVKANLSRIERTALLDRTMPKGRPLGEADARLLRAWIEAAAPEYPKDGSPQAPDEPLKPTFNSIKKKIFDSRCISCHQPGSQASGVPLATLSDLLNSPRELVLPGNPDESGLVISVTRQDAKRMPPPSLGSVLSPLEISTIRKWIEQGARENEGDSPAPPGGGSTPGKDFDPSLLTYANVRNLVFRPLCISCHGHQGGVNLETYAATKNQLLKIAMTTLVEKSMPKNGRLTGNQAALLTAWIKVGAPEGSTPGQPIEPLEPKYSSIRKNIFETRCLSCHAAGGSARGVPLIPYQDLLNSPRELVLPGNPDESGLMISLTRQDSKRMPPPNAAALLDAEIAVIRKWITEGAKQDGGP